MKKLTTKDIKKIPRSFDVIGDILIFSEIPSELIKKERKVGEYMLSKLKNIKVVALKIGFHKGIYRTRKIKIIAGEKRKETIYKENNARFKLDVEKCYFSPRLSNEREHREKEEWKDILKGQKDNSNLNINIGIQQGNKEMIKYQQRQRTALDLQKSYNFYTAKLLSPISAHERVRVLNAMNIIQRQAQKLGFNIKCRKPWEIK